MNQVRFFLDQYYLFSNYSALPVTYNGYTYPTSEHAYQSEKFDNNKRVSEMIKHASSPSIAKNCRLSMQRIKEKIGMI